MKEKLLGFKVSEEEKLLIEKDASLLDLSISDYLRKKVFNDKLRIHPDFYKALMLVEMYIGSILPTSVLPELRFILRSLEINNSNLNNNQREVIAVIRKEILLTKDILENSIASDVEFTDPYKPKGDLPHIIWMHFLDLNRDNNSSEGLATITL